MVCCDRSDSNFQTTSIQFPTLSYVLSMSCHSSSACLISQTDMLSSTKEIYSGIRFTANKIAEKIRGVLPPVFIFSFNHLQATASRLRFPLCYSPTQTVPIANTRCATGKHQRRASANRLLY